MSAEDIRTHYLFFIDGNLDVSSPDGSIFDVIGKWPKSRNLTNQNIISAFGFQDSEGVRQALELMPLPVQACALAMHRVKTSNPELAAVLPGSIEFTNLSNVLKNALSAENRYHGEVYLALTQPDNANSEAIIQYYLVSGTYDANKIKGIVREKCEPYVIVAIEGGANLLINHTDAFPPEYFELEDQNLQALLNALKIPQPNDLKLVLKRLAEPGRALVLAAFAYYQQFPEAQQSIDREELIASIPYGTFEQRTRIFEILTRTNQGIRPMRAPGRNELNIILNNAISHINGTRNIYGSLFQSEAKNLILNSTLFADIEHRIAAYAAII